MEPEIRNESQAFAHRKSELVLKYNFSLNAWLMENRNINILTAEHPEELTNFILTQAYEFATWTPNWVLIHAFCNDITLLKPNSLCFPNYNSSAILNKFQFLVIWNKQTKNPPWYGTVGKLEMLNKKREMRRWNWKRWAQSNLHSSQSHGEVWATSWCVHYFTVCWGHRSDSCFWSLF